MSMFVILFESIPEAITFISATLILLGYDIRNNIRSLLVLEIISGFTIGLSYMYLPLGYNTIVGLLVLTVGLRLILKIGLIRSFLISIFGIGFLGIFESIFIPLWQVIFNLTLEEILSNDLYHIIICYPHLIVMGTISFFAYKKNWHLLKLNSIVMSKSNLTVITIILIQTFAIIFINLIFYVKNSTLLLKFSTMMSALISVGLTLCILSCAYFIKRLFSMVEKDALLVTQQTYIKSINELFDSYWSQNQEFNNHLQVVYNIISNSGNTEAMNYLTVVLEEYKELNDLMLLNKSTNYLYSQNHKGK